MATVAPLGLEGADGLDLAGRRDLGHDVGDAELGGEPGRGGGGVAGQEDGPQAELAVGRDGLGRGRLHRVGDGDQTAGFAVPGDEDDGATRLRLGSGGVGERDGDRDAVVGQEGGGTCLYGESADGGRHAASGNGRELRTDKG